MVSTKCLDVTDRSLNIIRWLLVNSFGWALTPVLPTVVLVSFNHMTMLALAQLGIWNNYSKNLSLRDHQGSSNEPKAGRPGEPSHEVIWLAWGGWSGTTRLTESSLLGPRGLSIYTFIGGGAIPGRRLCMCEPWITQAYGVALTVPPTVSINHRLLPGFFHQQCQWLGGNGMGRPHQLKYLWHPPLDSAKHPRSGLFRNKNITLRKHIMNTVKYDHKSTRYKAQWHKTINMLIIKSTIYNMAMVDVGGNDLRPSPPREY